MENNELTKIGPYIASTMIVVTPIVEELNSSLYDPIPDPGPTPTEVVQEVGSLLTGVSAGTVDWQNRIISGSYQPSGYLKQ